MSLPNTYSGNPFRCLDGLKGRKALMLIKAFAFAGILSLSVNNSIAQTTDEEEDDEEVFTLSPFEVSTEGDLGYLATSSLAGSRLDTDLRDIGAAVQVVTPEFMKDVGATNLERLLLYTTNTEVGGIEGNFYGGDTWDKDHARSMLVEPHRTTRIRGLNTADITRDFFPSDVPIDWYALDRVDISRGPNAVLFGLGSPAGLINNSLKTPIMSKNAYSLEFRVDRYGSHREVLDVDQAIIPNELGIRAVFLNDSAKFRQDYTYNKDRRIYAAVRWQPKLGKDIFTQLDLNGEWAKIHGNRPVAATPSDFLTNWYGPTNRNTVLNDEYWTDPGDPGFGAYEALYGAQSIGGQVWDDHPVSFFPDPSVNEVGMPGNPEAMMLRGWSNVYGGGWGSFTGLTNTNWELWNPNHRWNKKETFADNPEIMSVISDFEAQTGKTFSGFGQGAWPTQAIIDGPVAELMKEQNIIGPNKYEFNNFETFNVKLTQSYWEGRIGWEAAYNVQHYRSGYRNLIEGLWGGNIVSIEINESLRNGEGNNPNVGRLYTIGEGRGAVWQRDRENYRLTGYVNVDAKDFLNPDGWLAKGIGSHTFTGVYSHQRNEEFNRNFALYRWDEGFGEQLEWGNPGYATWRGIHYLSPSQLDTTSMDQITGLSGITTVKTPPMTQTVLSTARNADGDWAWGENQLSLLSWEDDIDKLYDGASQAYDTTDSKVFVWQGSMFNNILVPIFGWREDEYERWNKPSPSNAGGVEAGRDPVYGYVLPWSPNWRYDSDQLPFIYAKEQRRSYSLAIHGKELMETIGLPLPAGTDITLLYNNSSSFRPSEVATDVYNRQEANPSGETEDYSILISTFHDRFNFRVTKYETVQKNTPFIGSTPPFNRNKAILGRVMDGMMWETAPNNAAAAADNPGTVYQPTPEWLVNKWMFGEGNYDTAIANQPLPFDWRDHPELMDQPLRIRHSAVPGSPTYVQEGDIDPESGLDYVAPPLTSEEIAYRTEWFKARSDAEWSRPADQEWWDAMSFERDYSATWGGFWELTAWEVPASSRSLNDLTSTGYEYEITANPLPNWRITFNASKAEAVRTNVLDSWDDYIAKNKDFWFDGGYSLGDVPAMNYWNFKGYYDIPESPGNQLGGSGRLGTGYGGEILQVYYQAKATEDQLVNELRRWHFNLVTNYTFTDGILEGLGIGGAYRWMDKANIGYYPIWDNDAGAWVNDLSKPIKGPTEDYVDFWVSYQKEFKSGILWSIQLNVYDVFADDKFIPTAANPDGTIAQVRLPGQTNWSISNTFRW